MLIIRPARHADLPMLADMAAQARAQDLTLPNQREMIERLIALSEESLEADIVFPGEERYLLVATANDDLPIGCIMIEASAGHPGADYSYRNDTIVHASHELGVNHRVYALTLSHDLSGHTRITPPLVTRDDIRSQVDIALLKGALAFIAEHPERFADDLITPLPGMVNVNGQSPFWNAVGSKFFGVTYNEAERLALGKDRSFLAELMPHHPLYVPLLPEEAQHALGQTRDDFMHTYAALVEEGFEAERYVDIFNGGPTFNAKRNLVNSIRDSEILPLVIDPKIGRNEPDALLCNRETVRFRAVFAPAAKTSAGRLDTTAAVASKLELVDLDEVRCVFA